MMDKRECCSDKNDADPACRACGISAPLAYWCETCQRQVAEKRCPGCGLKTVRVRRHA
ncbi:MAG: hypothetical protein Q7V04_05225 [Deltaproteobacteria bacterium]|nr:hypothetical protein [Deltaproteobacteria bacterium]